MKSNIFFRTYIYTCILLAFSVSLYAQTEDVKKLISIEKRRYDAMVHKDTALLKVLLADSLTFIHSSGVIDSKISFLKDIGTGRISYMFIIPEKLTATLDGNYAWIFGRANVRFKLAVMTTAIDQYISFVEVYRLEKSQWQMILCQNARIENNAPYYNNTVPQVKSGSIPSIY
ncbi:MAG TPA: nuclear transport factor 2 family protein [Puia sp.]